MLRKILEAQHRNGGLGTMLKTILEAAAILLSWVSHFFLFVFFSYLPIIVECCWTAASRSLSSIVHSPISEHPEKTRAQRHSVQIPPKKKKISPPGPDFLPPFVVSVQSVRVKLQKAHPCQWMPLRRSCASVRVSARLSLVGCCARPAVRMCVCVPSAPSDAAALSPCHGSVKG